MILLPGITVWTDKRQWVVTVHMTACGRPDVKGFIAIIAVEHIIGVIDKKWSTITDKKGKGVFTNLKFIVKICLTFFRTV